MLIGPRMPRLKMRNTPSTELVVTSPRAYSLPLWLTVSCSATWPSGAHVEAAFVGVQAALTVHVVDHDAGRQSPCLHAPTWKERTRRHARQSDNSALLADRFIGENLLACSEVRRQPVLAAMPK